MASPQVLSLFKGYSAIESMQDKTVNVVLNGVSRNDILAKLMGLFIPFILISVGLWLTMTKSKTLINVHKIREQFWDIFHGK
jgi:hypothetical protein